VTNLTSIDVQKEIGAVKFLSGKYEGDIGDFDGCEYIPNF
jgi:hypothetical protein